MQLRKLLRALCTASWRDAHTQQDEQGLLRSDFNSEQMRYSCNVPWSVPRISANARPTPPIRHQQ